MPRNRLLCAALDPVRDFMPLPARLEMEPNILGVVEPSLPSPSLFRGIVEDLKRIKSYRGDSSLIWIESDPLIPVHILGRYWGGKRLSKNIRH